MDKIISSLVIVILSAVLGGGATYKYFPRIEYATDTVTVERVEYKEILTYDTLTAQIDTVKYAVLRVDTVRTSDTVYLRDTLLHIDTLFESPAFIARNDTTFHGDTLTTWFMFPQKRFSFRYLAKPDTVVIRNVENRLTADLHGTKKRSRWSVGVGATVGYVGSANGFSSGAGVGVGVYYRLFEL